MNAEQASFKSLLRSGLRRLFGGTDFGSGLTNVLKKCEGSKDGPDTPLSVGSKFDRSAYPR